MNCICCDKPLTGGIDTFGFPGDEMCWNCWSGMETIQRMWLPSTVIQEEESETTPPASSTQESEGGK